MIHNEYQREKTTDTKICKYVHKEVGNFPVFEKVNLLGNVSKFQWTLGINKQEAQLLL